MDFENNKIFKYTSKFKEFLKTLLYWNSVISVVSDIFECIVYMSNVDSNYLNPRHGILFANQKDLKFNFKWDFKLKT